MRVLRLIKVVRREHMLWNDAIRAELGVKKCMQYVDCGVNAT